MEQNRVGLRELKEHTSRVVHRVRETGQPVDITYHGKTVARIVPAEARRRELTVDEWWSDMEDFGRRLSEKWPKGVSAVDAIREERR